MRIANCSGVSPPLRLSTIGLPVLGMMTASGNPLKLAFWASAPVIENSAASSTIDAMAAMRRSTLFSSTTFVQLPATGVKATSM